MPRKDFHTIAAEIQIDFLVFMHKLTINLPSDRWLAQLSSRNSAGVPLFRQCIYLIFAQRKMAQVRGQIIFVCEESAVARCLKLNLPEAQISLHLKDFLPEFRLPIILVSRLAKYFIQSFVLWIGTKLFIPKVSFQKGKKVVILRSWISKEVFSMSCYKDRNFGDLGNEFEKKGYEVWYAPMFFNLERGILATLRHLSRFKEKFYFSENTLNSKFTFLVAFRFFKMLFWNFDDACFRDLRIGYLAKRSHQATVFILNDMLSLKFALTIQELQKSEPGLNICRIIYPFENNTSEKILLSTLKDRCGSRLIAYQHSVVYRENLATHLHKSELGFHPLAHELITSGSRYLGILHECGFPKEILREGSCLRFNNIFTARNQALKPSRAQLAIILNYDINHAFELLKTVCRPLRKVNLGIKIKAHPLTDERQLKNFLKEISFPNYELVENNVIKLAMESVTVIMPGCSVSNLEVMATTTPLLRVSLGGNFDFDPVFDDYPFPSFCYSEEDVTQFLVRSISLSQEDNSNLLEFRDKILNNYFNEVSPKTTKMFLGEIIPGES